MSIFDRFESAVERGVNGAFSRVFRSGIKPVDITTAIRRAMDESVQEVSASRIIAANHFSVYASRTDLTSLEASLDVLADEFAQQATEHASANGYSLLGPVTIEFIADASEPSGTLKVDAENRRGPAAPATASSASPEHPIIDVDGEKWLLTEPVTVIGRGSEADIVVNDSGVSRRHLELRITPTGVIATDLGSTNGTFVEGHRIDAATLLDGNQIVIGRTKILFWTHQTRAEFNEVTTDLAFTVFRIGFLVLLWLLVLAAVNTLRRDIFGTVVTPRGKGRDKATSRRKASREKRKDKKRTSSNPLAPKDLLVTGGPLVGTMLPLGEAPIVIGRSPACTLVLEDEYASSRHAALTPQSDGWWIEDLSSRNGTFIDDERLSAPRQLKIGDVIRIGQTTLELVG